MAKNNSYKKLIAGTMTAAMVAGVVSPVAAASKSFPDVPADHWAADSIKYLVDKGAIHGKPDGTFAPGEAVDRASAATMFALILDLPIDENAKPSFKDAKNSWAAKYIAAVEKAGVVKGDGKENFYPDGKIDRASFASMLVSAYDLKEKVNGPLETNFDDLRGHWGEEKANILINLGISAGTGKGWEPNKSVTRAEAAQFIAKTDSKYAKPDNSVAKVANVTVTGPTQLTLTGAGLQNLTAEDVTLEGDKAVAIEASADGKSAVVTLGGKITPNKELTVKVKDESFKVTFPYDITKLAVEELTFDDDRADQYVVFKANDETGNADVEYLNLAGHKVQFVANKKDGSPAEIFDAGNGAKSATSTTGKLAKGIDKGDYKVEVQVTKKGGATISNTGMIHVKNLDAEATVIQDTVFAVNNDKNNELTYNGKLTGSDFALNSKTLVVGEQAGLHKVVATIAGENQVVDPMAISVTSSNPGIISVQNNKITAEASGKATITVKVGDVTKAFNFTVTTDKRKLANVKAHADKIDVVQGTSLPVTFVTTDQYGDPFGADTNAIKEIVPQSGIINGFDVITTNPGSVGINTVPMSGVKVGTGSIHFQNGNGDGLGSLYVDVKEANVASTNFELVSSYGRPDESPNTTVDLNVSNTVAYQLSRYTSEGVYSGAQVISGPEYTVESANPNVATVEKAANQKSVLVTAKQPGKTDILLKKNGAVVGKATVTVVQEVISIESVDFKPVETENFVHKKININTVLDLEASDKDDVVNGINLTKDSEHKVRVVKAGDEQGKLYLDRNGDAAWNAGDVALGYVTVSATSDSKFNYFKPDIYDTLTTQYTDKGTLVFKVLKDKNDVTTEYGTQAVTVNVLNDPTHN